MVARDYLRMQSYHGTDQAAQRKRMNDRKEDALEATLARRLLNAEALRLGIDKTHTYRDRVNDFTESLVFGAFLQKVIAPETLTPHSSVLGGEVGVVPGGDRERAADEDARRLQVAELYGGARYDDFRRAALASGLGHQEINGEVLKRNPYDTAGFTRSPPIFQVMGQRFVIDSFIFNNVVWDRVCARGA